MSRINPFSTNNLVCLFTAVIAGLFVAVGIQELARRINFDMLFKRLSYHENALISKGISSYSHELPQCEIPLITNIPDHSTILIGHVFGGEYMYKKDTQLFHPNIQKFLNYLTKSNDITLIFAGDVFHEPTEEKWNKLKNTYGIGMEIHVSPGNHDAGIAYLDNPYADIFYATSFGQKGFPYTINKSGFSLYIGDSARNGSNLSRDEVNFLSNDLSRLSKILIRHHAPFKELRTMANMSLSHRSITGQQHQYIEDDIDSIDNYSTKSYENSTIIVGDAGEKLDGRIFCTRYNTLRLIMIGFGNSYSGDVLVITNGNIFKYQI